MNATYSDDFMKVHRVRVAWFGLIFAVLLTIAWIIAIVASWQSIVDSHARLGYLVGDLGVVVPLCVVVWYGYTRGKTWTPPIFLILIGALIYDTVHFVIYLAQEGVLSISVPVYMIVMVLALLLLAWLARFEVVVLNKLIAQS